MRNLTLTHAELSDISAEIIGRGGSFCFKAHGTSMYPFIRDGDVLTVQPIDINTINVGDIVFYRSPWERLVAHRVIRKNSRNSKYLLTMRGDSGLNTTEEVPAEHVLGKVMSIRRGQKVIPLDKKLRKLAAHFWIVSYPLNVLFLRAVLRVKRAIF